MDSEKLSQLVGVTDAVMDLNPLISGNKASALNMDSKSMVSSLFRADFSGKVKSDPDTDPQLLIVVPFNEGVRLKEIVFRASENKQDDESGPKKVKIFVNRPNLDFAEAESTAETQSLDLSKADLKGSKIPLKFVKFQNVNSVTLCIDSNQGDTASTVLNYVGFFGMPIQGTNMNNLKKSG